MKEIACGFPNREHYKTAIYFRCGGVNALVAVGHALGTALELVKQQNAGKESGADILTIGPQVPAERPDLRPINVKFKQLKTKIETFMGPQTGFPF